ncbi:MAG: hypothetical protein AB1938_07190 [Myxococcota bacterium]
MESSEERSLRWGQGRDRLFLALRGKPVDEKLRAYRALERQYVKEARSQFERVEIQRRFTEDYLYLMVTSKAPWPTFARYLRRMKKLGFTTMDRRLLVCVLSAEAARGSPAGLRDVQTQIDDIVSRSRRRRDRSATSEEIDRAISRARKIAGLSESPPAPRSSRHSTRSRRR